MNRKFLIGAFVFAGVLALAFLFFLPQSPFFAGNKTVTTDKEEENPEEESAFFQAFTGGDPVRCTFDQDNMTSTAYVKEGKIRINSDGVDGEAYGNAIIDGTVVYAWQVGNNEGVRIDTSDPKSQQLGAVEGLVTAENIKEVVEESEPVCVKEAVDDTVFIPPSSVTFKDAAELLDVALPTGTSGEDYKELMEQYSQ